MVLTGLSHHRVIVSLVLLDGLACAKDCVCCIGVGLVIRFISAVHKRLGGGRDEASAFEGQAACYGLQSTIAATQPAPVRDIVVNERGNDGVSHVIVLAITRARRLIPWSRKQGSQHRRAHLPS